MSHQGKFYAHRGVDKDLVHCPPPQRIDATQMDSGPQNAAARTLQSRTDVRVCEPPRPIGGIVDDSPRRLTSPLPPQPLTDARSADDASPPPPPPNGAGRRDVCAALTRVHLGHGSARVVSQPAEGPAKAKYEGAVSAYARSRDLSRKLLKKLASGDDDDASSDDEAPVLPPRAPTTTTMSFGAAEAEYLRSKGLSQKMSSMFETRPRATAAPAPHLSAADVSALFAPNVVSLDAVAAPAYELQETDGGFVVIIGPISGATSAADLDVFATASELSFCFGAVSLRVLLPRAVDETSVRAKFKKQDATLRVILNFLEPDL
ncbi:hypothetical protein M885DRAFT_610437 [Pelagophyceae sp. CCMP2097]|nr:hypothetical protein M885DRAFT_610437 [Pelagophyceae sp. CCMP2097]